jgi:hypothetical protein
VFQSFGHQIRLIQYTLVRLSPHRNHKAACVEESVVPDIACSIVVDAAVKAVLRLGQMVMD